MKNQFKLDIHAHGPWTCFFTEPEGIFRWPKKKIIDSWFPASKTIDPLVETYLPHLKNGNVAIGLGSYTVDRFGKVMTPLRDESERKRLGEKYSLKDIDMTGEDYFIGFKDSQNRELYFINAQEVMVPEGHAVILPTPKPLDYFEGNGKYRTFEDVANEAKNLEVPALVFPTHPCMKAGLLGKLILRVSLEASWKNGCGMDSKTLEYYAQQGVLDGIEVWNSHAGKRNKDIFPEASRIADRYEIPKLASSDTSTPRNILTSYVEMGLDFSDPKTLTEGIRNDLKKEKYEMHKGSLEDSFWISLQHLAIN